MQSTCTIAHCQLWSVWVYHIYAQYLTYGTIYEKCYWTQNLSSFFSLQLLPKTFLILRRIWQDAITVHRSSYKVPITLVRFYWNLNFLERVSKIPQVPYLKTISPLGAKLFRADGQRDRHAETYSHFLQFCKLNYKHLVVCYFFYNYTLLCSYNWGLSHLINKCVACQSFHIFLTCTRWWFTD